MMNEKEGKHCGFPESQLVRTPIISSRSIKDLVMLVGVQADFLLSKKKAILNS